MASSLSPRGDRLLSIATLLVTGLAIAIVAVDLSDGPDLPAIPPDHRPRVINGWESLFSSTDRSHTVRVAVFSDYLCPYSADVAHTMLALGREFPDVLVEYRSLPQRGELSDAAAAIAECSRASSRFDEMHHTLFHFVDSLGVVPWQRLEAHAGVVDTVAFRNCAFGSEVPAGVERDMALAEMLGVTVTPSILVEQD
jgi:protein-disulfide isomerase